MRLFRRRASNAENTDTLSVVQMNDPASYVLRDEEGVANPEKYTYTEEDVTRILDAWNRPGPVTWYHEDAKRRLRREWPTLANALDRIRKGPR